MMYEAYEKKVRGYLRYVQIFKICVRCAIVALILGVILTLGYLSLRGIYFGSFELESQTVAFGDKPDYDCFVLFGTYRCEYAPMGSDAWSADQPIMPGEYRVRAVITKGFFGKQEYSEPGVVTLYRREVTLVPSGKFGASVPYGEQPVFGTHWEISSSLLAKGHRVDTASLRHHSYDGSGSVVCYVDPYSVIIRDSRGNDVTAGYMLREGKGSIKVKARSLTIAVGHEFENGKPVDIVKVYDGKDSTTTKYQITSGELLQGDYLSISATGSAIKAGRHENRVRVRITNSFGVDCSAYYNVKVNTCSIRIEKRPLTVTTPDVTLEYTGGVQYTSQYTITEGSIVLGQRETLVHNQKTGITDVTKTPVENKVLLQIKNGSEDVTSNYDITYRYGSLTVKERALHVRTKDSVGLLYNGQEQSYTEYELISGSLASGHRLVAKQATSRKVPGSVQNVVEYKILNGDGKDVTKNYNFKVDYGTLTIEKGALLHLKIQDLSKIYDSKPLDPDNYSVDDLLQVVGGKLFEGDTIEIVSTKGSQTDAGTSTYTVQYRIMHKDGWNSAVDATDWYAGRTPGEGVLTVNTRMLEIRFDPLTKQYDGNATSANLPSYLASANELKNYEGAGHKILLDPEAFYAHLTYTRNGQRVSAPVDIGSYSYTVPKELFSVVLDDGSGADRTHNYDFYFTGNTIEIKGISLKLTAPSATKAYDGTPLSADQLSRRDVKIDWGASGYSVTYSLTGSQTNAGTGNVGFADIMVTDSQGRNVTRNFEISTVSGKLTVTPLAIEVQSSSGSKVYDGKPMENATQMVLVSGSLLPGHVLGGSVNSDYVANVGTHQNNRVTPKVYSATGQDVTKNYTIKLHAGSYRITPADLYVTAPVVTGEYTGKPYEGTCDATASAQGLVAGQYVKLDVVSSGISLGMHPMQVTGYHITNARGADVSGNYNVHVTNGEIEIIPRRITLNTGSSIVAYDKVPAYNHNITIGGSGLLEGHTVEVRFTYPQGIYEIGSVSNTLNSYYIRDEKGRDVAEYYDVSVNAGLLRVKQIEITITTGSAQKDTYDAMPLYSREYEVTKGELLPGHRLRLTFKYADGVCDVGQWKNELSSIRVVDERGEDVSYMYDATVVSGILEITNPYPLSLITFDAQKVYDGTPLFNLDYALDSELLPGHEIKEMLKVTLTEAGTKENKLTPVIVDSDGRDVSKNYGIIYPEGGLGTLTVEKRSLSITVPHLELTYNGTPNLFAPQDQLIYEGLVDGERISIGLNVGTPEIGEKSEVEYLMPKIYTANGKEVTSSYEITLHADHIEATVVPAHLTLYMPERYSKEYDGSVVDVKQAGYRPLGLASGHSVHYEATETAAEPGIYALEFLSYVVYDKNGEDVTHNYIITANTCSVNIYKKYIKLTSESAARHYNGEPLFCHELKKYSLSGGYTLDVIFTGEQTEVGVSENTFTVIVYDAQGNDVTAHCNINYTYGTLEIWDQIRLELESGSAVKIYDGQPLFCHDISPYTLPKGYTAEIIFKGEITQPGTATNTFDVIVYDPNGEDVTSSFVIKKTYGTLEVLEKSTDWVLTLRSKNAYKNYDGKPLFYHELEPYQLPEGFELEVFFTGEQTAIGTSQNTFTARAYNERGEELTVVCEFGTLEVSLEITVNAYEMTYTYDGTEKNCENVWMQGLPEGFSVDVTFGPGRVVTGTQDVEIQDVRVYNEYGEDITALCDLTINTATLTVLPRALTVYVYGQSADTIAPVQGSLVEGHTMFAEYGENGECFIEIADENGTLVYSNRGDSPIKNVLYDVNIQYG